MSDRNGASRENHERAAELHETAAHTHLVASVSHEKRDHLTGHEHSRLALADSQSAQNHTQIVHADFGHKQIAALAHGLWEARGCPTDSPDQDWFEAARELREEHLSLASTPAGAGKGMKTNV